MSIADGPEKSLAADLVPRPAEVRSVTRETADTVTLRLAPPSGRFPFAPGQFNMLWLFGAGESAISISGDPGRETELVHTIRAVGAVTTPVARLRRGDVLGVRGPFGAPWPMESLAGRDVLVVAGGIGLAPLRPVVYEILRRRRELGRVSVLYGARSPRDLLYGPETRRWRARADLDLGIIVDHADASWDGDVGVVTALLERTPIDPARAVALLCGPEVMIRFTVRDLEARGVPATSIWVSLERNMKCAVGRCGHCQLGPVFVCRDGPVFRFDRVAGFFGRREL